MRRTPRRLTASKEEKVAKKIGNELTDFTLDLESVGMYLAEQPQIIYSRAIEVLEATEYNHEVKKYDNNFKEYSDDNNTF
jgi:hypothetical protein